ncbi:CRISPR-associated protein [Pelotomaculum sp. FP]|uniref:type I-C CRISPR-associated protein Cas8c/Csd1 n=1 Tax=Pelotomaculum sp. FP TaxID=261474 RepID=UPI0010665181|nr:type I-C CRISPR-associated protein Cas8c/Csd1 [Pelotomaculum sp. FP]TEB12458.1 CRISPR-associated protein [Pelotomaculum sp. FP]
MSWIQNLYETYENCQSMIGISSDENEVPLLPICHTTQKAQVEIVIDVDGNFKRARVIPKSESRTIIPCTESSGGRTSGEAPHPLCDKLQYVAVDYKDFGGSKAYYFSSYQDLLRKWCDSEYSHPKAKAVLKYIEKGNVIRDLIKHQVMFAGDDGILQDKWDKKVAKEAPNSRQDDAFIRWLVEIPGDPQMATWTDLSLFESWIKYYLSIKENNALCYVKGEKIPVAEQHPRNIRRDGDGAKLISSGKTKDQKGREKVNDPAGFTFLGRFSDAGQACGVGYEVTQKAHNALRWLIGRQGYRRGDQAIVAWSIAGHDVPDPLADPFSVLGQDIIPGTSESVVFTAQDLALRLKKKIAGYNANIGNTSKIVVMGLDSATPGRMAISFYRELTGSEFLARINKWHESCAWIHDYRYVELPAQKRGATKKKYIRFVGAPAPSDIAEAAYGSRVDDKLRKTTVERILPCIIDGQKLPRDLVESAVRRASNRIGMENWEWNKTLSIACALYRKYHDKEVFNMALDESRKTRDYLYGRLLALADSLEQWALQKAGETRQTTAARLMQRFADHPYSTWRTIELALGPYKARLGGKSLKRQNMISEVTAMFAPEDYINDKKLSGEFLLGYHCQREALWNKDMEEQADEN